MKYLFLASAVLLFGCGGGGSGGGSTPTRLRPAGSPDVVVLSVSGRCGNPLFCDAPADNIPYLGYAGDAAEAISAAFQAGGRTVQRADFFASFYSYDDTGDGTADRRGFLDLVNTLSSIQQQWISDFENPTRIVIVAHSHGCVWAHIATSVRPEVPIAYLVSLDGDCLYWETDYPPDITTYFAQYGNPFAWDIRDPCDHWLVSGAASPMDTEDVVWPNVAVNLEVRSNGIVGDYQINYRTDGSRTNIYTHDSPTDDHEAVHDPSGESMPWVISMLQSLGL